MSFSLSDTKFRSNLVLHPSKTFLGYADTTLTTNTPSISIRFVNLLLYIDFGGILCVTFPAHNLRCDRCNEFLLGTPKWKFDVHFGGGTKDSKIFGAKLLLVPEVERAVNKAFDARLSKTSCSCNPPCGNCKNVATSIK